MAQRERRTQTTDSVERISATLPPQGPGVCLVVLAGPDIGKVYRLESDDNLIGRSSLADVVVDDTSMSRNHARVVREGEGYWLRDLGSTNGTFVGDAPVHDLRLEDGMVFRTGKTTFKFLMGDDVEQAYYDQIYRLSTADALTGAYNKRYLWELIERELSRSRRYQKALALIIFDVDHFKPVNDRHGHVCGDRVLEELARRVRKVVRRTDCFARYGGEEFAVLAPETNLAQGAVLAEKLRRTIADHPFLCGDVTLHITVSLGVSDVGRLWDEELYEGAAARERFVEMADERLYQAKTGGRNRVCA